MFDRLLCGASHRLETHKGGGGGNGFRCVHTAIVLTAREARPRSCTGERRHPEQSAPALRHTEAERHCQSRAPQQLAAFPGGRSLALSDSRLIKARGDRKAMLSLQFAKGHTERTDSCCTTGERRGQRSQPPVVGGRGEHGGSDAVRGLCARMRACSVSLLGEDSSRRL